MLFNSYIFVFCFLPLSLTGYFLLSRVNCRAASAFLLGMSLWFYGWFNPPYLLILCSSILVNYALSRLILRYRHTSRLSKLLLILAVLFNVGLIFYFKYYDFFISSVNAVFRTDFALKHILLPLGISFYTFQQISYVVDSYQETTRDYGFLEYALFVSFFPQLVAGPIVLHHELIPQFRDAGRRHWNWENFRVGLMMFTLGLSKKIMLADLFGGVVNRGFADTDALGNLDVLIVMVFYTFQIYFDFSGYSDMAIGLGRMFNLEIPMNFNSPYQSRSVTEFWRRWHMTLTRFLRTYIYFPLGGNRKGRGRTYLNLMAVFLVSGLWHGANWTFVVWGCLHGLACVVERRFAWFFERLPSWFRWVLTFCFVNTAWLLFRAESIGQWLKMLGTAVKLFPVRMTLDRSSGSIVALENLLNRLFHGAVNPQLFALAGICCVIAGALALCLRGKNLSQFSYPATRRAALITAVLMTACILSFSTNSPFLYFDF